MCAKRRTGIASFDYGELMKESFSLGPSLTQRLANASRYVHHLQFTKVNSAFCPSGVGKSSTGLYGWGLTSIWCNDN